MSRCLPDCKDRARLAVQEKKDPHSARAWLLRGLASSGVVCQGTFVRGFRERIEQLEDEEQALVCGALLNLSMVCYSLRDVHRATLAAWGAKVGPHDKLPKASFHHARALLLIREGDTERRDDGVISFDPVIRPWDLCEDGGPFDPTAAAHDLELHCGSNATMQETTKEIRGFAEELSRMGPVRSLRRRGNEAFRGGNLEAAHDLFLEALSLAGIPPDVETCPPSNDDIMKYPLDIVPICSNLCLVCHRQGRPTPARTWASVARRRLPTDPGANARYLQAALQSAKTEGRASSDLMEALDGAAAAMRWHPATPLLHRTITEAEAFFADTSHKEMVGTRRDGSASQAGTMPRPRLSPSVWGDDWEGAWYLPSKHEKDTNLLVVLHDWGESAFHLQTLARRWELPQTALLGLPAPLPLPNDVKNSSTSSSLPCQWFAQLLPGPPAQWLLPPTDTASLPRSVHASCRDRAQKMDVPAANDDRGVRAASLRRTLDRLEALLCDKVAPAGGWSQDRMHLFGVGQGATVCASLVGLRGQSVPWGSVVAARGGALEEWIPREAWEECESSSHPERPTGDSRAPPRPVILFTHSDQHDERHESRASAQWIRQANPTWIAQVVQVGRGFACKEEVREWMRVWGSNLARTSAWENDPDVVEVTPTNVTRE